MYISGLVIEAREESNRPGGRCSPPTAAQWSPCPLLLADSPTPPSASRRFPPSAAAATAGTALGRRRPHDRRRPIPVLREAAARGFSHPVARRSLLRRWSHLGWDWGLGAVAAVSVPGGDSRWSRAAAAAGSAPPSPACWPSQFPRIGGSPHRYARRGAPRWRAGGGAPSGRQAGSSHGCLLPGRIFNDTVCCASQRLGMKFDLSSKDVYSMCQQKFISNTNLRIILVSNVYFWLLFGSLCILCYSMSWAFVILRIQR
jgi:hypothetical protein